MTRASFIAILLRTSRAAATLLLCVTLVFFVLRMAGDPATQLLPPETPPEVVAAYRKDWGLDRPIPVQYAAWLGNLVQGEMGVSFASRKPVAGILAEAVPRTLLLGTAALLLATVLGLTAGIAAALRHGTLADRALMAAAVLGYSMPVFFLGILLILLFALQWRILPSSGAKTPLHLILPAITLALPLAGRVARFARTAMLEVMGRPYIRTARAKGLGRLGVILGHALLMCFGIEIGLVLSGAVVTETIFAWPGLGRLLVDSVSQRDLPVVQGVILLITGIIVLSNLAVDIVHALIDPKVSLARTLGGAA